MAKAKDKPVKAETSVTPKATPSAELFTEEVVVVETEVKEEVAETVVADEAPVVEETEKEDEVVEVKGTANPKECGDCRVSYGSPSCKSCVVHKRLRK